MKKERKQRSDKTLIISALRKASKFSQGYVEATLRAKMPKERGKPQLFKCEGCGELKEKIIRDHIVPVVDPEKGHLTWDQYIKSMFVPPSEYQCICYECSYKKTQAENLIRKEMRGLKKKFCGHDDPSWCTNKCPKRKK